MTVQYGSEELLKVNRNRRSSRNIYICSSYCRLGTERYPTKFDMYVSYTRDFFFVLGMPRISQFDIVNITFKILFHQNVQTLTLNISITKTFIKKLALVKLS